MNRHNYHQPQSERGGNRHLRQQILEGLGQIEVAKLSRHHAHV